MKQLLLLLIGVLSIIPLHGQIATSNAALLYISNGAIVQINGGFVIDNASNMTNNGTLNVSKNSVLPLAGTISFQGSSTITGDGIYEIEQDWVNNANFFGQASTVNLYGNTQQFISSTNNTITTFNNLVLSGNGTGNNRKKTLQGVDAKTGTNGFLTLNDRELETQTFNFVVLNPLWASVTNNTTFGAEGFVSSIVPGSLVRATNTANPYTFPTGSSAGTLRYRPVIVFPNNTNSNEYNVRFNNLDATSDGFSRTVNDNTFCDANSLFYHSINRNAGSTPADISVFYIPTNDGTWSGLAQWQNANAQWNDMNTTIPNTIGSFATQTRMAWQFTNPGDPYILTTKRPDAPTLDCPEFCENANGVAFNASGSGNSFTWSFPSNATLTNGQGTNSAIVDWTSGTGQVSVITTNANGCSSLPANCTPIVHELPNVQFTYTSNGKDVSFVDQTVGAITWDWDFADGNLSSAENPTHTYSDFGNYAVILEVTDNNGCVNSSTQIIELMEDIFVPNIITPNNDGENDAFIITTGTVSNYAIIIQNRWGNVVYESNDPTKFWDGKSNGVLVAEGVYFYQIKLDKFSKSIQFQGNVTVVY